MAIRLKGHRSGYSIVQQPSSSKCDNRSTCGKKTITSIARCINKEELLCEHQRVWIFFMSTHVLLNHTFFNAGLCSYSSFVDNVVELETSDHAIFFGH